MRSAQEFIDHHWQEIENLSIPIDDLVEDIRRNEAHHNAGRKILFPNAPEPVGHQDPYVEMERVLRVAKQHGIETLSVKTLLSKKEWLQLQVPPQADPHWLIGHLIENSSRLIGDIFVTNFSDEELADIDCTIDGCSDEDDDIDTEFERRFIVSKIAEERMKTGYEGPGHILTDQAAKLSIKISCRIDEILRGRRQN